MMQSEGSLLNASQGRASLQDNDDEGVTINQILAGEEKP